MTQQVNDFSISLNVLRDIYQSVFMIQKILLVHQETSLPVFEKDVELTVPFDAAMISGILQAISSIGQEMIGRPTGFKKLQFNGFVVTGSYFNGFTIYVFSETELDKEMEKGMKKLIQWFSMTFGSKRVDWDGSMDIFNINKSIIDSKIAQYMYLWLLYPFSPSADIKIDIATLAPLGQEIFRCVSKNLSCTAAKLLDHFKQVGEEKILHEIFNLADKGCITTSFND